MTLQTAAAVFSVALLVPLAGCDETAPASLTDEATVVADAQIARQNGDYAEAATLLEGALDRNPASAVVRTELATTVLGARRLNLLDLDRLTTYIAGKGAASAGPGVAARGAACRYAAQPGAEPFDPTEYADFPDLEASRADIDRARALIDPVLPAVLKTFDACTTIGPDGALVYDQTAAADELRATGMSDVQIGQLLATNALARFFDAYLTVTTDVPQPTTWYRLPGDAIGVCADDPDALRDQTRDSINDLGTAVLSLDTRSGSFGGDRELIALALNSFKDIRDAFGDVCGGN